MDLGLLEQRMAEVQKLLDHKLLDMVDARARRRSKTLRASSGSGFSMPAASPASASIATVATKVARISARRIRRARSVIPPPCGEGRSSEAKTGVGVFGNSNSIILALSEVSPTRHVVRCARNVPPSPQGGGIRKHPGRRTQLEKHVTTIEGRKQKARAWFEQLRDDICVALEKLEADAPAKLYPGASRAIRPHAVGAHRSYRKTRRRRRDVDFARAAIRESRRALSRRSLASSRRNFARKFRVLRMIRDSGPRGFR